MKITKAIIPVAGWGTRRLPITKAIEKCMLPIGNRPLVDYIVQDCLEAGIKDLYFVVGEQSTQLRDYYRSNIDLNDYLRRVNKTDLLNLVRPLSGVKLHYVIQPSYGNYGTAVAVGLAAEQVAPDESVVVLMGDDFIFNPDGMSQTAQLIKAAGDDCAILGVKIDINEVSRYGVIEKDLNNNFVQIVEKPSPSTAPSNLINVSKYVLNSEALDYIKKFIKTEQTGEYYITEPINQYVKNGGKMTVLPAQGQYLDGGSVEGWLHANNVVLKSCK